MPGAQPQAHPGHVRACAGRQDHHGHPCQGVGSPPRSKRVEGIGECGGLQPRIGPALCPQAWLTWAATRACARLCCARTEPLRGSRTHWQCWRHRAPLHAEGPPHRTYLGETEAGEGDGPVHVLQQVDAGWGLRTTATRWRDHSPARSRWTGRLGQLFLRSELAAPGRGDRDKWWAARDPCRAHYAPASGRTHSLLHAHRVCMALIEYAWTY